MIGERLKRWRPQRSQRGLSHGNAGVHKEDSDGLKFHRVQGHLWGELLMQNQMDRTTSSLQRGGERLGSKPPCAVIATQGVADANDQDWTHCTVFSHA